MSNSSKMSSIDLVSCTKYQYGLHYDSSNIASRYENDDVNSPWCTHHPEQMEITGDNENLTVKSNNKYDYQGYTYISQPLNKVCVAPEHTNNIKIRYTENLGHHINSYICCKVGTEQVAEFDEHGLDNIPQWLIKDRDDRDDYKKIVGNQIYLTEWTDFLPYDEISTPFPFSHSENDKYAIPLFLLRGQKENDNPEYNKVEFTIKRRTNILDLIEMIKRTVDEDGNETWHVIKPNARYLVKLENDGKIPFPEIWADYHKVPIQVRQHVRDQSIKNDDHPGIFKLYIRSMITIQSRNPVPFGKTELIPLRSTIPVLSIFFKARNIEVAKFNGYSNYTNMLSPTDKSKSPISMDGIKYGNSYRIPLRKSNHSSRDGVYKRFPCTPEKVGYHAHNIDPNMRDCGNIGLIYNNLGEANLEVKLGDSLPMDKNIDKVINEEDDIILGNSNANADDKQDKYHIFVNLLTFTTIDINVNTGAVNVHKGGGDDTVVKIEVD